MTLLFQGDCLEWMNEVADNSVDVIFTDLPYGQVSCEWDKKIDFPKMWEQFMRVKKITTPIFFCCSTKFGVEIINSAPKKCPFRYDIVWVKSAPCGFLCAKKMPMKKHEMLYVFYEKLPFYDLSSHTHKFKDTKPRQKENLYGMKGHADGKEGSYDPPLPTSVQKDEGCYGEIVPNSKAKYGQKCAVQYDPPLPTSVQKADPKWKADTQSQSGDAYGEAYRKNKPTEFQPNKYDPPLPTSVQKEEKKVFKTDCETAYGKATHHSYRDTVYEPPLPNSILEIKSQRGKHSTQKPTDLMKWVLKYYSKEGDVVLDPTMGSGSTGVACVEMNRNFIGIEMNPEIFEVARERLEGNE